MMIKSVDVHEGDSIRARDRATILEDLRGLDERIAYLEAVGGPGAWQNCLNCLSEIFFWGVGEVTSDDGDDTYTLKPKYISNTGVTESDAMTTGDMDTADGIKPSITATAVGTGEVSVEDEFLVFGGFDAGAGVGEPIVRYFFESRGGAEWIATELILASTGAPSIAPTQLGIELDTNGAMTAEVRAYFRFAAPQATASFDHIRLGRGSGMAYVPWEGYIQESSIAYLQAVGYNVTVHAGLVSTAIPDIINWAAQPTVVHEQELYYLHDGTQAFLFGVGNPLILVPVGRFSAEDYIATSYGIDIYGIRLRCELTIQANDPDWSYWWHDGSAASGDLTLLARLMS